MRVLFYITLLTAIAVGVVWATHKANENPAAAPASSAYAIAPDALENPDATLVVEQLMFRPANLGATFPEKLRPLPHYWATEADFVTPTNNRAMLTYLVEVDLRVPDDELWSIYIPHVLHDAQVSLNGNPIGRRLQPPLFSRAGLRSKFIPLPRGALQLGLNRLEITVTAKPARKAMLGKFYIGPASVLQSWHDGRVFQHQLLWFVAVALALIGLIAMVLGLSSTDDPTYNWFAAMCLAWLVAGGSQLLTQSAIDWQWVDLAGSLGRISFICISLLFCRSFIGESGPKLTRLILTLGGIAAAMYVVTAVLDLKQSLHLFLSIGALQLTACFVAYRFYKRALSDPGEDIFVLALGGSLILGFGVYDTVVGFTNEAPTLRYLNYLTPMLFLLAGYILLRRFSRALKHAQTPQVAAPVYAAEASSPSTTGARRILVAERERIMRDMHDGVGGHLVSSLSILRNHKISDPDLEEALSQALVDLRLMIDSLEETDGDLSVAVAMLKDRTQRALKGSPIETSWRIEEIVLPERGPADTLQILRILQESISNVLKHANADALAVSARMVDKKLAHFFVHDNGQGFDTAAAKTGRGLLNLRRRAEAIGAELEISSSGAGTRVDLWVPNSASDAQRKKDAPL